jgi:hypothetical protein
MGCDNIAPLVGVEAEGVEKKDRSLYFADD